MGTTITLDRCSLADQMINGGEDTYKGLLEIWDEARKHGHVPVRWRMDSRVVELLAEHYHDWVGPIQVGDKPTAFVQTYDGKIRLDSEGGCFVEIVIFPPQPVDGAPRN